MSVSTEVVEPIALRVGKEPYKIAFRGYPLGSVAVSCADQGHPDWLIRAFFVVEDDEGDGPYLITSEVVGTDEEEVRMWSSEHEFLLRWGSALTYRLVWGSEVAPGVTPADIPAISVWFVEYENWGC
jgi:hypothetical protein